MLADTALSKSSAQYEQSVLRSQQESVQFKCGRKMKLLWAGTRSDKHEIKFPKKVVLFELRKSTRWGFLNLTLEPEEYMTDSSLKAYFSV